MATHTQTLASRLSDRFFTKLPRRASPLPFTFFALVRSADLITGIPTRHIEPEHLSPN